MLKLIIFTDLDGSLLDHYSYSHRAAENCLEKLEHLGIPVIFNTSKTFAELVELRERIDNAHPFIGENGAAVYLPKEGFMRRPEDTSDMGDYWVKEFCPPRDHWQKLIRQVSADFVGEFKTFGQYDFTDIMQWTGLSEHQAKLAMQRQYGEPIHWFGTEERGEAFKKKLARNGATVLQGGRFIHISGDSDKGQAMNWLSALYGKQKGPDNQTLTLAIGDGPNDVAMLDAADYALVIKSPVKPWPNLLRSYTSTAENDDSLIYSEAFGPEGWAEGVEKILTTLNIN